MNKKLILGVAMIAAFFTLSGCSSMKVNEDMNSRPIVSEGALEKDPSAEPTKQPSNLSTEGETATVVPSTAPELSIEEEMTKQAKELLDSMSIEEKVAQMFFVRCPEKDAAKIMEKYQFGGYLLFGRDFKEKTKTEVINDIASYQKASKVSTFIGVDEEGGGVTRISRYKEFREKPFLSPRELYEHGDMTAIIEDTVEKAELLSSLGINVNFAPVCDIAQDKNDFMYNRSFGKDAMLTSDYVANVVRTMKENKMIAVLKHFPGYGNNVDTHTGIAVDKRSYGTFLTQDFVPFKKGIENGADFVLVSHNIVNSIDAQYPASLSPKVHQILREDLEFDGIIITDDLAMDAIGKYTGNSNAAVLAVLAGNDMLCSTNMIEQMNAVVTAVSDGTISKERIDESVLRILKVKLFNGI